MKFNIQTKLMGSYLIIIAIMVGLGIFALYQLSVVNDSATTIGANVVPSIEMIDEIQLNINHYRQQQLQHVISTSNSEMDAIETELAADDANIDKLLEQYKPLIFNTEEQRAMEAVAASWQTYLTQSEPFLAPSRALNTEAAMNVLKGDAQKTFKTLDTQVKDWVNLSEKVSDQALASAQAAYLLSQRLVIGALVGAGIIALALGFWLARSLTTAIRSVTRAANGLAVGDLSQTVTVTSKDELGEMAAAFRQMIETLRGLVAEANMLTQAAVEGRLSTRGNIDKFQGDYRKIVQGVNDTLDAVIGPLNVAAAYVDRISKGDIPPKITDTYNGDFNTIKNNLNTCIEAVNLMIADANMLSQAAVEGKLATRADATRHQGDFRKIVQGVNDTLDAVIGPLNVAAAYVDRISKGDIPPKITDAYNGDFNTIKNNLNTCIEAVNLMIADANMLSRAAVEGKLATRADALRHQGDFRKIVQGVDDTLDAVIGPLNVAAVYVDRIAKGDIPPAITDAYNGDFNDIKNNLNELIKSLNEIARMAVEIAAGNLALEVKPRSELDQLLIALRQMIANLRELIGQVQEGAEQVAEASQQLNAAASQSSQAGQQVASTIQQVAQGTSQQTTAVNDATSGVEQISRAAEGIAKGSQEQAQSVQKTSDLVSEMAALVGQVGQVADAVTKANTRMNQAARSGAAAVGQTGQGMESIRGRTSVTADKIKEMGSRSKEIGRIIETIDDIADKTDMLALNAAVEAARAGEAGRGFAVVADQVRKLSEDSKVATRDIGTLIERVQDTINEAVAAMQSTTSEVDNGVKLTQETTQSLQDILQAAEEAAALSERIDQAVSQLKQKSQGVVTSIEAVSAVVEENTAVAEQMAANSEEVSASMESVAGIAEENSASAEEVSALAEEMSAQSEEVVASAEELSALAEELRSSVAQFRVDGQETAWSEPRQPQRKVKREAKTPHAPATRQRLHTAAAIAGLGGDDRHDEAQAA